MRSFAVSEFGASRFTTRASGAGSGKTRIDQRCLVMDEIVRQAVAMLKVSADAKEISVDICIDPNIPLVWADPDRVFQALTNLIENAIKFTPPKGSVLVEARLVDSDSEFVYLSVKDTGPGIRPEAKALIFERLFQVPDSIDTSRTGLGLGLYITKQLVQLHGGRIWVESQPGQGSIFSFTLPLFSLSKVIFPVVTEQGRLREAITLIAVQVKPQLPPLVAGPEPKSWTCSVSAGHETGYNPARH